MHNNQTSIDRPGQPLRRVHQSSEAQPSGRSDLATLTTLSENEAIRKLYKAIKAWYGPQGDLVERAGMQNNLATALSGPELHLERGLRQKNIDTMPSSVWMALSELAISRGAAVSCIFLGPGVRLPAAARAIFPSVQVYNDSVESDAPQKSMPEPANSVVDRSNWLEKALDSLEELLNSSRTIDEKVFLLYRDHTGLDILLHNAITDEDEALLHKVVDRVFSSRIGREPQLLEAWAAILDRHRRSAHADSDGFAAQVFVACVILRSKVLPEVKHKSLTHDDGKGMRALAMAMQRGDGETMWMLLDAFRQSEDCDDGPILDFIERASCGFNFAMEKGHAGIVQKFLEVVLPILAARFPETIPVAIPGNAGVNYQNVAKAGMYTTAYLYASMVIRYSLAMPKISQTSFGDHPEFDKSRFSGIRQTERAKTLRAYIDALDASRASCELKYYLLERGFDRLGASRPDVKVSGAIDLIPDSLEAMALIRLPDHYKFQILTSAEKMKAPLQDSNEIAAYFKAIIRLPVKKEVKYKVLTGAVTEHFFARIFPVSSPASQDDIRSPGHGAQVSPQTCLHGNNISALTDLILDASLTNEEKAIFLLCLNSKKNESEGLLRLYDRERLDKVSNRVLKAVLDNPELDEDAKVQLLGEASYSPEPAAALDRLSILLGSGLTRGKLRLCLGLGGERPSCLFMALRSGISSHIESIMRLILESNLSDWEKSILIRAKYKGQPAVHYLKEAGDQASLDLLSRMLRNSNLAPHVKAEMLGLL